MKELRVIAKAVIIRDGYILVDKMYYPENEEIYYILPGGGHKLGETLVDTLQRECMEEIGAEVLVGDIVLMREHIGKNHGKIFRDGDIHRMELAFTCSLQSEPDYAKATQPDLCQLGIDWLPLARLKEYPIYPYALTSHLDEEGRFINGVYMGDIE